MAGIACDQQNKGKYIHAEGKISLTPFRSVSLFPIFSPFAGHLLGFSLVGKPNNLNLTFKTCLCYLRCYLRNFSLLWEISTLESVFNDEFSVTAFTGYVWTVSQSGEKKSPFSNKMDTCGGVT